MKLLILSLIAISLHLGVTLRCYRCMNGYATSTVCSNQLPSGNVIECSGTNPQCYESIQWFNNGSLQVAIRDCWTPPNNRTRGGFCENYNSTEGVLRYCRNCTSDVCNTDVLYYPAKLLNCYV
ncbi:hypothetical protein TcasGA2_TC035052 [Tribolium castaneum]|uniref:Protein sleepless n=1 Tax=Tribolium castaneum TaxID=7070 RepID=A0A139WFX1_TRICA|nr:PREDICTED: uncharacterized protein LOC103313441 [Tribolium castaneum]KYB26898.1 hypothetical protein TcasGA2_TC035052 [Tribolium castaneum]|eukprot:XP_008194947.1 PREDICTED: uncharacterized protein LOC103313441 [Tribolium castaneum]